MTVPATPVGTRVCARTSPSTTSVDVRMDIPELTVKGVNNLNKM